MNKNIFLILALLLFLFASCSASRRSIDSSALNIYLTPAFDQSFTGFALYDPEEGKYIYQYNADKYFMAASNMKLFTLYAGLKLLPDSVPGLYYKEKADSLIFWGTGDPSFLHPKFHTHKIYSFLKNNINKHLYFSPSNFTDKHFGSGWAWDDYFYTFSAEKAPFPIYGNYLEVSLSGNPKFQMPLLKYGFRFELISEGNKKTPVLHREPGNNRILYFADSDTMQRKIKLPFKYSPELFTQLLSDTLKTSVSVIKEKLPADKKEIFSMSTDSLYKEMLWESDNLIAEQLLLLCSGRVSDELNSKEIIKYLSHHYLGILSDSIRWVDGSGLSRYNLATPRSIIEILNELYRDINRDRLFKLFPAGGKSGTLKDAYKAEVPFVFAKTGSFSNNYNISGYLITKSGKTLTFSFMNNNFMKPSAIIRSEVEKILSRLHEQL